MANIDVIGEDLARRIKEFVDDCRLDSLIDIYKNIFGEDDLVQEAKKELDKEGF